MNFEKMRAELREYYENVADAHAEQFCDACVAELDAAYEQSMSVFAMKRLQYRLITEKCDPVLFWNSPFYYETGTMAAHCDGARDFRGHRHAGGWTYWRNKHLFEEQDPELFALSRRQKKEKMYLICGPYNDVTQHFCFYYRPVLEQGLKGIYERALSQMEGANERERDFLQSVCDGVLCLKQISEKFAKKAAEMADKAEDAVQKANLRRIANAASRTPWEAPQSFYEALNCYALLRKAVGALEGIGFSTFGRLDMDLYPFYERDLANGTLKKDEAFSLISQFLVTFDCHYDHDMRFKGYADHELENTYVLGGCDAHGEPFCNALTLMFLRATREEKVIFPKIKLRYSDRSPKEMLDEANISLLNGTSVILYQNDNATIPAVRAIGKTEEEARDYIIFGCWGINGNGIEKYDDGSYVNLIKPLELAVHRDFDKMREIGMEFQLLDDAQSFEELYQTVLENINVLFKERTRITRAGGNIWDKVDVLPLFSSTLQDCIGKRKDYTEGGAKYRDDHFELFAFGNLLDSLMAIKELCFEKKKYTLKAFLEAVRSNWAGKEEMRIEATRCHGWGDGSKESNALAGRLNRDMSDLAGRLQGTYGGKTGWAKKKYIKT